MYPVEIEMEIKKIISEARGQLQTIVENQSDELKKILEVSEIEVWVIKELSKLQSLLDPNSSKNVKNHVTEEIVKARDKIWSMCDFVLGKITYSKELIAKMKKMIKNEKKFSCEKEKIWINSLLKIRTKGFLEYDDKKCKLIDDGCSSVLDAINSIRIVSYVK